MTTRIMQSVLPVLALLLGACGSEPRPGDAAPEESLQPVATESAAAVGDAPYDFTQPDVSFALPEELQEISGLTVLPDGRLGTVQDEEGILYVLSGETGAVEARYPFGGAGDYEGIERVGDRLFVLRSNGTLLELSDWAAEAPQVRTHKTDLKGKNDAEGLGYDPATGHLLIACKEDPGAGLDDDRKAVYAFDPGSGALASDPVYVMALDELEQRLDGRGTFKPSAVAVHPDGGTVYVLSATAKALAVLGEDGGLRHAWPLPEAAFEQPEGLAFLPDGTLFIASEGGDGPAMLYRFSPGGAAR